jgi:2-pyrone-4,6-dicarboxylate lactonase
MNGKDIAEMIPACAPPREPTRPRFPPPPDACDTHAHVFGPGAQFPYAADRSYTPPDAPLAKYLAMLDTVGFARGVLVQGSAHGGDNAAMLDALARHPDRLRGVAVADAAVGPAELRRWHALGVRGLRFNHFFRGGALHYRGGVPLDAAKVLAPVMAELGWHLQLWIDVKDLPDTIPTLEALALPVVIDHMGRTDARAGTATAGFQSLLRLVGAGGCWVKVSGAHRLSQSAPAYADARPFHQALVRANPERLVWGSDWPHPRIEGEMPDAGRLFELFHTWTPDDATRRRILVGNPAKLYGFASAVVTASVADRRPGP